MGIQKLRREQSKHNNLVQFLAQLTRTKQHSDESQKASEIQTHTNSDESCWSDGFKLPIPVTFEKPKNSDESKGFNYLSQITHMKRRLRRENFRLLRLNQLGLELLVRWQLPETTQTRVTFLNKCHIPKLK